MPTALLSPRLFIAVVTLALILAWVSVELATAERMPNPWCPPFC